VIYSAVSPLDRDSPIECLGVFDDSLDLDCQPPLIRSGHRVPRAQVAGTRKRNLRLPSQSWMKFAAESLEQPRMGDIPNRISGWIDAHCQVESDDGSKRSDVLEVELITSPPEAPDLRVVQASSSSDFAEAQSCRDSSASYLRGEARPSVARSTAPAVARSLSRGHRERASHVALACRLSGRSIPSVLLSRPHQASHNASGRGAPRAPWRSTWPDGPRASPEVVDAGCRCPLGRRLLSHGQRLA
jgi:hypothetical protein